MRVVLFRHASVGMPKLRGDDAHRNALHHKRRALGMAQHMERRRQFDLRDARRGGDGLTRPAAAEGSYPRTDRRQTPGLTPTHAEK
jgi:hypothetical protein